MKVAMQLTENSSLHLISQNFAPWSHITYSYKGGSRMEPLLELKGSTATEEGKIVLRDMQAF